MVWRRRAKFLKVVMVRCSDVRLKVLSTPITVLSAAGPAQQKRRVFYLFVSVHDDGAHVVVRMHKMSHKRICLGVHHRIYLKKVVC